MSFVPSLKLPRKKTADFYKKKKNKQIFDERKGRESVGRVYKEKGKYKKKKQNKEKREKKVEKRKKNPRHD